MNDNEVNLLSEIKQQIERFDAKANILSAISGVLLGMSFGWIPIFKNIESSSIKITMCFLFVFVLLYIIFLCLALLIFIWTILPRSKPKKINKKKTKVSNLYYKDLQKMKLDDFEAVILQNQSNSLAEQIQINSMIATKKHKMLVLGIIFLILSIFSIVVSISLYMFI